MKDEKRELYDNVQNRLVGSLLYDSSHMSRILELINEEDIEEPTLALIFSVMAEISRLNQEISPITVAEILDAKGELTNVGGTEFLYTLISDGEKFSFEAPVEVYARIIKEASAKAKIARALQDALPSFADNSGKKAADSVSELQSGLNESLLKLSDSSTIVDMSKNFDTYLETLKERKQKSDENSSTTDGLQGIPSLLPTLNKLTTGWLEGQLITVGARTGIGKSILACNCATGAAMAGKTVMFFSLEMGETEIEDRILSSMTGIPMYKLKQGRISDDDRELLTKQMKEMEEMRIIIDTEPKQTVDSIRARALRQAQSSSGLDMIILDYLQLVTPTGRHGSRQEAVSDLSRNMKLLAKQLQIPIMVLVQLNRASKDEEQDTLPRLDDIRESGAIAQDSDIVILIHRNLPSNENKDETTPLTSIILAKNRNGENNRVIKCHSNLECSLFREIRTSKDINIDEDLDEDLEGTDGGESLELTDDDIADLDLSDFVEEDFTDDLGLDS